MDPEEAQKLIDEEILALKTRRNTYARISRLPNELLVEIFATLGQDLPIRDWHSVTHVCRHWRQVALESAMLWRSPPTSLHDYTLLSLERSRTSPLEVGITKDTSEDTIIAILQHIHRIDTLYISHSESGLQVFQNHLEAVGTEAPLLHSIDIAQDFASSPTSFRLCHTIFNQFPVLSELSFCKLSFDWGLFPLKANLSYLSLVGVRLFETISWTQFYDALHQMPSLEQLIVSFNDLQLVSPPHFTKPLELPLLESLIIDDSRASVIGSFLNNSSFPRLRNAFFECSFDEGSVSDDLSTTIHAVFSLIPRGRFGCLDKLSVEHRTFCMDRSSDDVPAEDFSHSLEFTAIGPRRSKTIKIIQESMTALAALPTNPTSHITHLHLSAKFTSQHIFMLFGSLPRLEEIVTSEIGSRQIIGSLRIPQQHPQHLPPPFSKVKSLQMSGERLAEDYTPKLFENLVSCLAQRSQHGIGLVSLFVQWDLSKEDARRLQGTVVDVRWGHLDSDNDF